MAKRRDKRRVRGARSLLTEDQPSFVDEHGRRGKHLSNGRKAIALDHVGLAMPDSDAETPARKNH